MNYKYLFVFIFCFGVHASEINDFLKLSYQNDPVIKKILNDRELLNFFVDQGVEGSETLLSIVSETGYVNNQDENNSTFGIELTKQVLSTGTDISVSHAKTLKPGEEGTTSSIMLEQSLLQNSFGSNTRLKIETLNLEKNGKELESVEELENYLLVNINKYLQFKKAIIAHELAQSQLKEARKIQNNLVKKYKSKVANKSDLDRGGLLLLNREENLIERVEEKNQYEFELLNITGNGGKKLLSTKELDLIFEKINKFYESKKNTVVKEKIRSFIIAKNSINIAQNNIDLTENEQSASLNFVVGFNRLDNTRFSTVTKQDETVVGLNYTIPIGDSQAEANTNIAKIQKISNHYKQLKANSDFESNISKINNDLSTLKTKLKINTKKVELTKSLFKEETKKYSIGQLSLDQLIDIKYGLFELENENLEIKVQYLQTMVSWLSLTDQLIGIESYLR